MGKTIKDQLMRNGRPDDSILDWVSSSLPYFPAPFIKEDAIYSVIRDKNRTLLTFPIIIFSPITILSTMMKIDEISGGFQITNPRYIDLSRLDTIPGCEPEEPFDDDDEEDFEEDEED
jgi:hypothetical protein